MIVSSTDLSICDRSYNIFSIVNLCNTYSLYGRRSRSEWKSLLWHCHRQKSLFALEILVSRTNNSVRKPFWHETSNTRFSIGQLAVAALRARIPKIKWTKIHLFSRIDFEYLPESQTIIEKYLFFPKSILSMLWDLRTLNVIFSMLNVSKYSENCQTLYLFTEDILIFVLIKQRT